MVRRSVRSSVCVSVGLSVRLFISLSVCRSVSLTVRRSDGPLSGETSPFDLGKPVNDRGRPRHGARGRVTLGRGVARGEARGKARGEADGVVHGVARSVAPKDAWRSDP